jgi:hypothetical protein
MAKNREILLFTADDELQKLTVARLHKLVEKYYGKPASSKTKKLDLIKMILAHGRTLAGREHRSKTQRQKYNRFLASIVRQVDSK